MKLEEWGNVIVSWANFLDPYEKVTSVEDLSSSQLFTHLLKVLGQHYEDTGDSDALFKFLQDEYPSLDLGVANSECIDDTILRATAFLIYCSIHHEENVVQKKMTDLPGWMQLYLTEFLKEFVDVSKSSISRDLVFSEISKILTPSVEDGDKGSPKFGTPLTYSSSPSTGELSQKSSSKKASKVKKLRSEIETLSVLKSELTDELENSKERVNHLEGTIQRKDLEISRLKSELLNFENKYITYEPQPPIIEVDNNKIDKLNLRIDTLEQENAKLKEDLQLAKEDRELKIEEIQKLKNSLKEAELMKTIYENDRTEFQNQITEHNITIGELRATNKELSDYITDLLTQPKDDSKRFSDSLGDTLIFPESLGQQVIDLEIQELKEIVSSKEIEIRDYMQTIDNLKLELKNIEDKYAASSKEFIRKEESYLADIGSKEATIKSSLEELRNLECQNIYLSNTVREKDSIVVSMQSSINLLNDEVHVLRNKEKSLLREMQSKDAYNQQLLDEIDALTIVINENSTEKDLLMTSITEKENTIQQCFMNLSEVQIEFESQLKNLHNDLESRKEEIRLLSCEKMELTSGLEYYREQITFYETKLKEREEEILDNINIIGKLESDIENFKVSENKMKSSISCSESKIKELTEMLESKECHLSDLENIISSLTLEKTYLLTAKKELEDQVSLKLEKIGSLESTLNRLEEQMKIQEHLKTQELSEFNSIINDLRSSVTTLNTTNNELCLKNEALNIALQEQFNLNQSYELQIGDLKVEVLDLNEKNHNFIQELACKDSVLTELKNEIRDLKGEISQLNTKYLTISQQLDIYMAKYESEVRKNENLLIENSESKDNISKLLIENEEKEKLYNKLKSAHNETEQTKLQYKSSCDKLECEVSDLKLIIAEWVKQNSNSEDLLKEKESTIDSLKTSIEMFIKEAAEGQNILESLKSNIDREKCENKKLKLIISEKENELHELKMSMKISEDLNIQQINILNKEIESFRTLKEMFENENEIFKKEIKDTLCERESIVSKLTAVEIEHSVCGKKILNFESLVLELKERESCLLEKLNKTSQLEADMQILLNEKNARIGSLQEEIAQKELSIRKLEISLSDAEKDKQSTELELKNQLENFEAEIKLEKLECQKLTLAIEEKNKENQELLNRILSVGNEFKIEINSLNIQLDNCKSMKDSLQNENDLLKSEVKEVTNKLKAVEFKHLSCAEKIQNTELVISELREKASILKEELSKSNDREESFKAELEGRSTVITSLKEELKSLKKTLSDREFDEGILFTKLQAKEAEVNKMKLEIREITKQSKLNEEKAKEEINIHIKKINDLDSTIGKLNNQFIKVNREKETILMVLEEKEKTLQDLMALKAELDCIKSENKRLEKDVIVRSEEVNQVQNKLDACQKELATVRNDKELLQSKLQMSDHEIQALSEQIKQFKCNVKQENENRAELFDQIAVKDRIIADLEKKMSINGNAFAEIDALKAAISSKDELIKKYAEEKNLVLLDLDIHTKKEDFLNSQLEFKGKEIEEIRHRLTQAEAETSKLKVNISEQDQTIRSLYATLHSQNSEMKEKDATIACLEKEIKTLNLSLAEKDNKIAEAVVPKCEKDDQQSGSEGRLIYSEKELEAKIQELKGSYEKKVDSYKATVKKRFAEKLEDLTYSLQNENTELKEKFLKEQERCNKLQSELWNASDKLLIQQEQNRTLLAKLQTRNVYEVVRPSQALSPMSKARSMEVLSGRNRGIDNFARDISLNESSSSISSRRSSIRSLPRGMGKVFPAMDEDGEVFDNRYLADLKAGICRVPTEEERMSTLQYRNSLCPPHLKSSYPAETQFFTHPREDEIKSAPLQLASSESDGRRTKNQSSYKKPGPPTPSKNGGRLSSQDPEKTCPSTPRSSKSSASGKEGVVNESFVLRESNHRKPDLPPPRPPKAATPSRLKALFTSSKKDENSPRRKSTFLRKN